jgi:hypothetical protein
MPSDEFLEGGVVPAPKQLEVRRICHGRIMPQSSRMPAIY